MSGDGKRGCLVGIEGIDGAGKSTQIRLLDEWLRGSGIAAAILKEPTDGVHGRQIRQNAAAHRPVTPEEEMRLFIEDRRDDVRQNILPALAAGKLVIMDRYYQSNMAYQGARGLDPAKIEADNVQFSPVPDLVIVLDIDPAVGLSRITNSRKTALDSFEKDDYLKRVREIFLTIGRKPNGVIIDASQPPEKVRAAIVRAIKAHCRDPSV
jgi:dTMP kinase